MKIIQRLYQYINEKGVRPAEFERMIGVSNGYISKMYARLSDVGEGILLQIIENCPDLNPMWLILGRGEMFNDPGDNNIPEPVLDKLLNEIKELSAKNERLKMENERLANEIGKKSLSYKSSAVVGP
ncbi:hypothetical protein [Proteiniphilum acetatigenes]|uniref:hypothetical protein n=1 Tax=Proteiniphilum acetatigenes TaxID=294710 RepID=UPI000381C32F|nr:hypothetical protein [Proteiniphilum acetatigenes]SFL16945.1 hypothetical protein SAMN05216357_11430 [Porphyromonadaceae bacterium KH3CP3RA]